MKIFLTGFMGCGKTFVGKKLASLLKYDFIDLDDEIEKEEGEKIRTIFEQSGESYFRKIEQKTLLKTQSLKNTVISCGGGTPCFFENADWMNNHGISIFLDTEIPILLKRLQSEIEHRPLLQSKSPEELRHFIEAKLEERKPFYEIAGVVYHQKTGEENAAEDLCATLLNIIGH